jgi:hypothetical protein
MGATDLIAFLQSALAVVAPALAVYVGIRVDIERHSVEIEQLKISQNRLQKCVDDLDKS